MRPRHDADLLRAVADAFGFESEGTVRAALEAARESARRDLHAAIVAVDRARAARPCHDALAVWIALTRGEWSIVDRFDENGRRYLIAAPLGSEGSKGRLISKVQCQILARAVRGEANKRIARELSISESRVSAELRIVAEMLGARSRMELVRLLSASRPAP